MKRCMLFLLLMATAMTTPRAVGQMAVGTWRDCLDLSIVYAVEVVGHEVYAAGRNGVLRYHYDKKECTTLSKSWGLSDVGVAKMVYDVPTASLVLAYNNSNIDIMQDGVVYNISDIKRSDIVGDKDVYSIVCNKGLAYFCTGFGIVVVDLNRHEIRDTYRIGDASMAILSPCWQLSITVSSPPDTHRIPT